LCSKGESVLEENKCEKCKELNKKLGIENYHDYEAVCDECWDKRLNEYEKRKESLMKDYQISKESYQYFKDIEKKNWKPLSKALLLQVSELNGKYVVFHVISVREEDGVYIMTAEEKATFNTHAEAKMSIRALKVQIQNELGIKTT